MKIIEITQSSIQRITATDRRVGEGECGLVEDGVAEALVGREDAEVVEDFATIGYECARSAAAYFEDTPEAQDEETLVEFLEGKLLDEGAGGD